MMTPPIARLARLERAAHMRRLLEPTRRLRKHEERDAVWSLANAVLSASSRVEQRGNRNRVEALLTKTGDDLVQRVDGPDVTEVQADYRASFCARKGARDHRFGAGVLVVPRVDVVANNGRVTDLCCFLPHQIGRGRRSGRAKEGPNGPAHCLQRVGAFGDFLGDSLSSESAKRRMAVGVIGEFVACIGEPADKCMVRFDPGTYGKHGDRRLRLSGDLENASRESWIAGPVERERNLVRRSGAPSNELRLRRRCCCSRAGAAPEHGEGCCGKEKGTPCYGRGFNVVWVEVLVVHSSIMSGRY